MNKEEMKKYGDAVINAMKEAAKKVPKPASVLRYAGILQFDFEDADSEGIGHSTTGAFIEDKSKDLPFAMVLTIKKRAIQVIFNDPKKCAMMMTQEKNSDPLDRLLNDIRKQASGNHEGLPGVPCGDDSCGNCGDVKTCGKEEAVAYRVKQIAEDTEEHDKATQQGQKEG